MSAIGLGVKYAAKALVITILTLTASMVAPASNLSKAAAASEGSITIELPDGRRVDICQGSGKVLAFVKGSVRSASLRVDPELAEIVARSDESFFLKASAFSSRRDHSAVLISRVPSMPGKPEGFCGAGHEDYLILVGINDHSIVLRDKVLVQSCLQSISLVSDEGDDPRRAIELSESGKTVRFSQSSPPDFKPDAKQLIIANDKFEASSKSL